MRGVIALLLLTACSFHNLQEQRLERRFARADLVEHTTPVGHTSVHYWEGGEGEPVLLLHGFGGDALWQWHGQLRALDGRRIVAPDIVYFGSSRSSSGRYSVEFQAETFVGLLDELGIERADVVGISYGGIVAFTLAALYPDRVDQLVLVDSPGTAYTEADYAGMLDRFGVASVTDIVVPETPDDVRRLIALAYHEPPAVPGFILADIRRHMFTSQTAEKVRLLDDLLGRRDELMAMEIRVDHPSLVVWGEHDVLFPLDIGQRLASQLGAELVVIPDANHAPNIEHPDAFNTAIVEFLGAPRPSEGDRSP